jgi:predicted DNA binding CopG/RHH family protein
MNDLKKLLELVNKANAGKSFTKGDLVVLNELKAKYPINDDGNLTTVSGLAGIMGKNRKTIQRWMKSNMPVELDGSFNVDKILAWRGEKPSKAQPQGADFTNTEDSKEISEKVLWDTEFRKYRSKISELDYLQKKGQLIEREAVKDLLVARITEFKQNLLQRDRRLSVRLANKDAQTIQQILDEDSIQIMEYYSRENPVTGKVNADAVD